MKAAIRRSYGGPGVMEYADAPDPTPEEGRALVKSPQLPSIRSKDSSATELEAYRPLDAAKVMTSWLRIRRQDIARIVNFRNR